FKKWNKNLVAATLKNEVYTGKTIFNRTNHLTGKIRPRKNWIITQSHPAIIEEEIFMRTQELFEERAPSGNGGSPHSQFVFTGLLRCGRCGLALRTENATGRNKRRYYYYNCQSAQKGAGCKDRRIAAHELDEWLIECILDRILTRERLVEAIAELQELTSEYLRNRDRQLEALAKKKRDVDGRLRNVSEILETQGKNAPNVPELLENLHSLKEEQRGLVAKLAVLEDEEIPDTRSLISDSDVQAMAEMMRDIVTTTRDVNKLRRFFGSFIERIVVLEEGLRIEYQADKLVNPDGFDVVRGKTWWLPDRISLRTAMLKIPLPEKFFYKVA
ncbi:recombinase family protein, partial [Nitrosovibrio sp. Nv17]|uniref:recombinase family protein n=1 Tax=Nitrosovibrio sp. Nv17 TaxID=1855339 RepID=UPI000908C7F1